MKEKGLLFGKDTKKEKAVQMLLKGATKQEILEETKLSENTLNRLLYDLGRRPGFRLVRKIVYRLESAPR